MQETYVLTGSQVIAILILIGILMCGVAILWSMARGQIKTALDTDDPPSPPSLFERQLTKQHRRRGYYVLYLQSRLSAHNVCFDDELTFLEKHDRLKEPPELEDAWAGDENIDQRV